MKRGKYFDSYSCIFDFIPNTLTKDIRDCFFDILIIDHKGCKYYTLELDFGRSTIYKDGVWIIWGQSGSSNINYGRKCKDDLEEFEKCIQDMIDEKPYDESKELKNVDFEEASKFMEWMKKSLRKITLFID